MSAMVEDQNGDLVEIYADISSGYVDTIIRAKDRATFETAARARGLYYEETLTVTDPETGEQTQQGTGEWKKAPGVNIDPIGPVTLTPAIYDVEGVEITPAVVDTRYHVNMRIDEPALSRMDDDVPTLERWKVTAVLWSMNGTPVEAVNAAEDAVALYDVELIDPDTISSPSRVWAT